MRAAGVGQPEQLCDFVERFARRVVARFAEHAVVAPGGDIDEQCVAAGHEQGREWRHRLRMLERLREDVSLEMVHGNNRNAESKRERLGVTHADEQRADEPGRIGDANGVNVRRGHAGVGQRPRDDRHDGGQVSARRNLRHYAAKNAVDVLRENHQRIHARVVAGAAEHGRRGFVAGGFDAEDFCHSASKLQLIAAEYRGNKREHRGNYNCLIFLLTTNSRIEKTR